MIHDLKPMLCGDFLLTLFDQRVIKLNYFAGIGSHHVIVVLLVIEFKNGVPAFEVMPQNKTGRLKLREHTIDGGNAHIVALVQELFVNIFCTEVTIVRAFQQAEDFESGHGDFKARFLEICIAHLILFQTVRLIAIRV